jgi:membrane associated rhomboid family serine protease
MFRLLRHPRHAVRLRQSFPKPRRPISYFSNPYKTSADTTAWSFIGANSLVYLGWLYAESSIGPDELPFGWTRQDVDRFMNDNFVYSSSDGETPDRWWTAITSSLSHDHGAHFLSNMVFYSAFASILSVCPGVGGSHILALILGSATLGSLGISADSQAESRFVSDKGRGASSVVCGMGAAVACAIPAARLNLFFLPLPAFLYVPLYVMWDDYAQRYADDDGIKTTSQSLGLMFGFGYYFLRLRRLGRLR